jgi:hypothetical protein
MFPLPTFEGRTPFDQPLEKDGLPTADCPALGWVG